MSKIVFGILSAVHSAGTVSQLCEALAPHPVVIHHDFSQQPEFQVGLPHVSFVPDPQKTGWDSFDFTNGLFHLVEHCLQDSSLDYFQLLSPTCLPIKPLAAFEALVNQDDGVQVHSDGIDLLADDQALVNFGYRTFVPDKSLRMRALFRASELYFGKTCREEMRAGLSVRVTDAETPVGKLVRLVNRAAAAGVLGSHPFTQNWRPFMGSTWFGATRPALQWLLDQYRSDSRIDSFRALSFADELLISTYLHNSPFRVGPAHHLIARFDHARPQTFTEADLPMLKSSDRLLARKFADDPSDPTRLAVLEMIAHPAQT